MRRKVKNRNMVAPDFVYKSAALSKFINCVMAAGKKNTARKIVYGVMDDIKEKLNVKDPIEVFDKALENASPVMEVRSRRIGGATYQVPREIRPERRLALAFRWMISAARAKKGAPMRTKLYNELAAAYKGEGEAIRKKENTHKMAEANRAFAHFTW